MDVLEVELVTTLGNILSNVMIERLLGWNWMINLLKAAKEAFCSGQKFD